jgi:phenylacetate-CoA ligase
MNLLSRLRAGAAEWLAWREGSPYYRYYRYLLRTQWDDLATIQARQFAALRSMLEHCAQTVPYYQRVFAEVGFRPEQFQSPEDLARLPILTKADLRRAGAELRSVAIPERDCVRKTTSGSTGVPLTVWCDQDALQFKRACALRSDEWSGWHHGEPKAMFWGNANADWPGLRGRLRKFLIDRTDALDALNVTEATLEACARRLVRMQPRLLVGHAHTLYLFGQYVRSRGFRIRPAGIVSTAMPLHQHQRDLLKATFECRVLNRYGCEETSLIASQCEAEAGLHLNCDNVYAELLPNPVGDPNSRIIVLTDLVNRAMPLIRYQVGDVVVPSPADAACPCGRAMPTLQSVNGRDADYVVTPEGRFISGISLTENFALKIPNVSQVQVVQPELDRLLVRVVPEAGFNEQAETRLRETTRSLFGESMHAQFEFVESIPQEPSGKYRFCISEVARQRLAEMLR